MRAYRDRQMVRALEEPHLTIVHHDDEFAKTTSDTEWMQRLGSDGPPAWIVISGDGRILKNKAERAVLDEVGLPFFCLEKPWPNTPIYEYAWKFMKVWPRIIETAQSIQTVKIFKVSGGAAHPASTK